ncbi:MAG: AhpC/TSA family protein [Cyclobacteriaceae bacterium]|nr:AhpC/TSA family protein [Cyclobacteriaceae bacterium]
MKNIILPVLLSLLSFSAPAQTKPNGLVVGEIAPDFTATDQTGKKVNLKQELVKNSVVLVFYRGQWCPYCNKELQALEDSLQYIRTKGATVIAVTPELPENISKTVDKTKASYAVLHDQGLKIMRSYDVAFQVDSLTNAKYKTYGIDFTVVNGNQNGAVLPVPAVYVINKKGKITYRHFDPDYRRRASIREILKYL